MDHAFKLAVAVAVAGLVACSSDDGQPSSSSGGTSGTGGTSSGNPPSPEGGSGAAKKENAEVGCNTDEECKSAVCFKGGNQTFCSVKCTADNAATVCVAPFTGSCNKQGFCKRD